jgi:hypothetical protein
MEVLGFGRAGHDIHNFDYVVMLAKVPQQLNLAQNPLSINQILKYSRNSLNRNLQYAKTDQAILLERAQQLKFSTQQPGKPPRYNSGIYACM